MSSRMSQVRPVYSSAKILKIVLNLQFNLLKASVDGKLLHTRRVTRRPLLNFLPVLLFLYDDIREALVHLTMKFVIPWQSVCCSSYWSIGIELAQHYQSLSRKMAACFKNHISSLPVWCSHIRSFGLVWTYQFVTLLFLCCLNGSCIRPNCGWIR